MKVIEVGNGEDRKCEREEGSWLHIKYVFRYLLSLMCLLITV
jgi:hypothetical protein